MFADIETGPLGRPIEGFEFSQGGVVTRVTSADTPQLFNGNSFEVLEGISRTRIDDKATDTSGEITITVPSSFPIAAQYRATQPSQLPVVTIFQRHLNDGDAQTVTRWQGEVSSVSIRNRTADMLCILNAGVLQDTMPRSVASGLCNSLLFDNICQVNRSDYSRSLTLTSFDVTGTELSITGLAAAAADINSTLVLGLNAAQLLALFNRGVVNLNTSPNEFRRVVETNVGGDPDVVRISYPFRTAAPGAPISVEAGCDLSLTTCNAVFQNAINFDGAPYLPIINPFTTTLDGAVSSNQSPPSRFSPFGGSRR